jgi:MFS family permease
VLVSFGLLAPLYFAAVLTLTAAIVAWRKLPESRVELVTNRHKRASLSYLDPRYGRYLAATISMFLGFASLQQTLGFSLQDQLELNGVETAQMLGSAMMISAIFAFLSQMVLVQRLKLSPDQFLELGMLLLIAGAVIVTTFDRFSVLAVGMAFMGTGMGLVMPAAAAGASLAVSENEQGAVAGLVGSCPAMGFVIGPLIGGTLYQIQGELAPMFSAFVFFIVLLVLRFTRRKPDLTTD